jgi:hypothetical protein
MPNRPHTQARTGWLRRPVKGGRSAWGPGDPSDGLAIGGSTEYAGGGAPVKDSNGFLHYPRFFFDATSGAFRAGLVRLGFGEEQVWDAASRGFCSVAIGGANTRATAANAVALGTNSNASASGGVAIGNAAAASGTNGFASPGSTASQTSAVALAGGTASAGNAVAIGGTCSGTSAVSLGQLSAATRAGQISMSSGRFAANGDAQTTFVNMLASTSDATATELFLVSAGTYLTIGATRTMAFVIRIAAHRTDVSGTAAVWTSILGGITRDSSGNCRLLGSVTGAGTTTLCDAGGSAWSVAVTADSTNNRLAVTVTGEAGKTIRWAASVYIAEVG